MDLNSLSSTVNTSAVKGELIMAIYELGVSFRHGWGVSVTHGSMKHLFVLEINVLFAISVARTKKQLCTFSRLLLTLVIPMHKMIWATAIITAQVLKRTTTWQPNIIVLPTSKVAASWAIPGSTSRSMTSPNHNKVVSMAHVIIYIYYKSINACYSIYLLLPFARDFFHAFRFQFFNNVLQCIWYFKHTPTICPCCMVTKVAEWIGAVINLLFATSRPTLIETQLACNMLFSCPSLKVK